MNKKHYRLCIGSLLILVFFATVQMGYCQDNLPKPVFTWFTNTFDGSIRNTSAVRLHELDRFVKIENRFTLGYDRTFSDHVRVILGGAAVYDAFYDVEDESDSENNQEYWPFRDVTLRPEDDRDYHTYVELQEALIELSFDNDNVDLRVGKQQQIGWGKVQGSSITDVVKPRNRRGPGMGDLPLWMAKLEYDITTDAYLQFLVIPQMEFIELAPVGSEYDALPLLLDAIPSEILASLPPGLRLVIDPVEEPDLRFENTVFGVKFDWVNFPEGWDCTLNYLYTWNDDPVFHFTPSALDLRTGTLTLSRTPERLHVIGGAFATNVWKGTLRGEVAAKFGKYFYLDTSDLFDLTVTETFLIYALKTVKKTLLSSALEFERKFSGVTWLFQALQERILDYDEEITYPMSDAVNTTWTLGGFKQFRNSTVDMAFFVAYGTNAEEFFLRPSVQYAINDSIKIKAAADLFEGEDDDSFLGYFDEKDRVYIELKYSF